MSRCDKCNCSLSEKWEQLVKDIAKLIDDAGATGQIKMLGKDGRGEEFSIYGRDASIDIELRLECVGDDIDLYELDNWSHSSICF